MRAFAAALVIALAAPMSASADIELSPLRQVLTDKKRVATFAVSNPSNRILDGRVSWIDLTTTPTGYAPATTPMRRKFSAAPYLTLSPAQFRLEPGARIEITVKLKKGVRPPRGEKRSHLLIETAAARTLIRKASSQGLQADIGVGVSAPVILRGEGRASAIIGETKLLRDSEGMLLLSASIEPGGEHSSYGRMVATFLPAEPGAAHQALGVRENVAGFTDSQVRKLDIPLGFFSLGAGELTLRYEGAQEYAGQLFDERIFEIAPPQ